MRETDPEFRFGQRFRAEIEGIISHIDSGELAVERQLLDSPSPRAFGLATLSASDVVLAEDESAALQRFHEHVLEEIDEESVRGLPTDD